MKPKLLAVELWGLGDLVIATPFLRAASKKFSVTLLAKPFANELRPRLWPEIEVIPFTAPWTAFRQKYYFWRWPWLSMVQVQRRLAREKFDFAVSARWDPRDHFVLRMAGARERIGFARLKSQRFLTHGFHRHDPLAHHYDYWRELGETLGLALPPRDKIIPQRRLFSPIVLIHSGARLPARIWPLENYRQIVARLRAENFVVQVVCDPDQRQWWLAAGEKSVATPVTVTELLSHIDRAGIFIGNCSGPGHLAAICGVPTFTVFGPSLPEWFAPLHPAAEIFEGKACPYKPCSDYCRFAEPFCLTQLAAAEVWPRVEKFVHQHLSTPSLPLTNHASRRNNSLNA